MLRKLSQMQKAEIYQLVARSGLAGLIDVELPAAAQTADDICEDGGISLREQIDELHAFCGKVICSYHEFDRMLAPEEILGRIHIMQDARSRRVQDRSYGCNERRCGKLVEDNGIPSSAWYRTAGDDGYG